MNTLKKIILIIFLLFCFYIVFILKNNVQTNLIKTILPQKITNYSDIISVADKSSSIIKIVFEGNNKDKFLSEINKEFFDINEIDTTNLIKHYKNSSNNLLSDKEKKLIQNKQYEELYYNALIELYNPISVQILPFSKDPYFLLSDFLSENELYKNTNNNLSSSELIIKSGDGLSPDLINKEIKKLIKIRDKLQDINNKIYLAGTPIHSYYTSKNSVILINIITILSLALIGVLSFIYFKNIKIMLPIMLSISIGILTGFCAVKLLFNNFHIITMVFSTAIIGLGIDYSYHYFFSEEKDKTFKKNLTFSMLTTIIPFIIFYLTDIELLKQIAIFSTTGLIAIYLFVLNFYPDISAKQKFIKTNFKTYKILFCLVCLISLTGYLKFGFDDSLSALYKPSKELLKAENLYNSINYKKNNAQIIIINGENKEDIQRKEEKISEELKGKNIDSISLSTFFPSDKTQRENYKLVKSLYNKNLYKFKGLLTDKQINELKNTPYTKINPPEIKMFTLNNNASLMYVFSSNNLNINENGIKIINIKTDIENCLKKYRYNLLHFLPYLILSVIVILCILFGIRRGLKVVIPPLTGMFSAIGLHLLILGELNLFSLIALFLILGFTIDYAIFKSENPIRNEDAVFVSALTTGFSFLLLSFTSFKLLSSIAAMLTFGIIVSYLCSSIIFRERN